MLCHAPSHRFRLTSLLITLAGLLAALAILAGSALAHGSAQISHHFSQAHDARIACLDANRHRPHYRADCAARDASKRKSTHRSPYTHHEPQPSSSGSSGGSPLSPPASPPGKASSPAPAPGESPSSPVEGPSSPPAKESVSPPSEVPASPPAEQSPSSPAEVPSSASATVNATPTGPASPASGWHVAFADGFGVPIGAGPGQDNFWYPNRGCCNDDPTKDFVGDNTDELEVYNSSQVSVNSSGLQLADTYSPNREPAEGSYPVRNYVSGTVRTLPAPGYRPFAWKPGGGETWAFECYCKFPSYFQGMDIGWWSTDKIWTDEVDFFESWTTGSPSSSEALLGTAWIYETSARKSVESWTAPWQKFDPSAAFHRYTTVITPSDIVEEYVDGVHVFSYGAPPYLAAEPEMSLILSNAIRSVNGASTSSQFTSGSRDFDVRSIAVYEDGDHAGQGVSGGGVAPGTTIG